MIRLWSAEAPLACPSSNRSRPRTRAPGRVDAQYAAAEPSAPSPTTMTSQSRRSWVMVASPWTARSGGSRRARHGRRRRPCPPPGPAGRRSSEPMPWRMTSVTPESMAHPYRGRARRLVLDDPVVGGEVAAAQAAGRLVLPRPDVAAGVAHRRADRRVHLGDGRELVDGEVVDPRGSCADPAAPVIVGPGPDVAGGATQDVDGACRDRRGATRSRPSGARRTPARRPG